MKTLPIQLEENIKALVGENKIVEAVSLVQRKLQLGLKESKDIVDTYRSEITSSLPPEKIQNTIKSFMESWKGEILMIVALKKMILKNMTHMRILLFPNHT